MQSTESLILEYGRSHIRTARAHGLRQRIRRRARKGDDLAKRFLGASFREGGIPAIQKQLASWLGRQ